MNYYLGNVSQESTLGDPKSRYFYGLRISDDGELFLIKIDQWVDDEFVIVNLPGFPEDDWEFFENGIDFFDGRDEQTKEKIKKNLYYDQYRFDSRSVFYYLNENGELVVRVNQQYDYPSDL